MNTMKNMLEVVECYQHDPIDSCNDEILKSKKDSMKRYTQSEVDVFQSYYFMIGLNELDVTEYLRQIDKDEFSKRNQLSLVGPRIYTRQQFYHNCLQIILSRHGEFSLEELSALMPDDEHRQALASIFKKQTFLERITRRNK